MENHMYKSRVLGGALRLKAAFDRSSRGSTYSLTLPRSLTNTSRDIQDISKTFKASTPVLCKIRTVALEILK